MDTFETIYPKVNATKSSAYPTKLFVVRGEYTNIDTKNSEQFHKLVAKVLFDTKRAIKDTGRVI